MSMETFRYTSEGEQYIRTGNEIAEKIKRPRINSNLVGRTNSDGTGKSFKVNRPTEAKASENIRMRRPDFSLQGKIKECEKKGFNEIGVGSVSLCGSERDIDARISKMSKEEKQAHVKALIDMILRDEKAAHRAVREQMNKANVQGA